MAQLSHRERIERLRARERARRHLRQLDRHGKGSSRSRTRNANSKPRPMTKSPPRRTQQHEKVLALGITQLLCGITAIILGVISIATKAWGFEYASGFWSGIFFVGAGIFGILSHRTKARKTIIPSMVLSSVSAMLALVALVIAVIGIVSDLPLFREFQLHQGSSLVVHCLLVVICLVELVCATVSGVHGCRRVCLLWDQDISSRESSHPASLPSSSSRLSQRRLLDRTASWVQQTAEIRYSQNESPMCDIEQAVAIPPVLLPPYSPTIGAQQDVIINKPAFPDEDAESYSNNFTSNPLLMQTTQMGGGYGQVMYVVHPLQNPSAVHVPQSGRNEEDRRRPTGTPPPSYSQININQLGTDEDNDRTSHTKRSANIDGCEYERSGSS